MAKGISIHIGVPKVNEKEKGEFGTLQGCDNDATEMAKLAKTRGFRGLMPDGSDADEPQVLVDEDAKKPTILKLIQTAAIRLEAGDFFLMTYSGHGGQAKNQNPADEKDDGEDEFLHPFDEPLMDDELREAWKGFKQNVRVVLVTDACHSGTVADLDDGGAATAGGNATDAAGAPAAAEQPEKKRKNGGREKEFSKKQVPVIVERHAELFARRKKPKSELGAIVMSMAACDDSETTHDATPNGEFTSALLEEWKKGKFKGTHQALLDATRTDLPNQHPQFHIEGGTDAARSAFATQQAFEI